MRHFRSRHGIVLVLALAATGSGQQTTPAQTATPKAAAPCGATDWVDLRDELAVVVDGIVTVEPPAGTTLVIPEGDHVLNGASLRILADTLCVPGKARILAFEESKTPAPKSGTPAPVGQGGASNQGPTGTTGAAGDPGTSAHLIELFVNGKVTGTGTLVVVNNGMAGGQGQQGGQGGLGGNGNRGRNAKCLGGGAGKGGSAGRGGKGGTGGPGGPGGNGGTVLYDQQVQVALNSGLVTLTAPGGSGGLPGLGGVPGNPGQPGPGGHGDCHHNGGDAGDSSVAGPPGDTGTPGQAGQPGDIRLVKP